MIIFSPLDPKFPFLCGASNLLTSHNALNSRKLQIYSFFARKSWNWIFGALQFNSLYGAKLQTSLLSFHGYCVIFGVIFSNFDAQILNFLVDKSSILSGASYLPVVKSRNMSLLFKWVGVCTKFIVVAFRSIFRYGVEIDKSSQAHVLRGPPLGLAAHRRRSFWTVGYFLVMEGSRPGAKNWASNLEAFYCKKKLKLNFWRTSRCTLWCRGVRITAIDFLSLDSFWQLPIFLKISTFLWKFQVLATSLCFLEVNLPILPGGHAQFFIFTKYFVVLGLIW